MGRFAPYFGKLLTHDQSLSFEKFNQPKLIPKKFFFRALPLLQVKIKYVGLYLNPEYVTRNQTTEHDNDNIRYTTKLKIEDKTQDETDKIR